MKKISLLLAVFLLLFLFTFNVSAKELDASLSVSSRTAESGNIYVFASLNDIKTTGGISYLEYTVKYDPKVLQLKNTFVNIPDTWGDDAEDWSKTISEGEYYWAVFNVELGYAVKDDNQLFIELEFIPLKDNATTKVTFDCIEICGDDLSSLDGKSVGLNITVSKDSNNSIVISDSSVDNNNDNTNSNNSSNNNNIDNNSNADASGTKSDSDSKTDDDIDLSNDSSNNKSPSNGGSSSDNKCVDSTAIIIVSVIIALCGAGVAITFFIRSKKGDK